MTAFLLYEKICLIMLAILGAVLVFSMYVNGMQTLIGGVAVSEDEKKVLFSLLGHKWTVPAALLVIFLVASIFVVSDFFFKEMKYPWWLWGLTFLCFIIQGVSTYLGRKAASQSLIRACDVSLPVCGFLAAVLTGVLLVSFAPWSASVPIFSPFNLMFGIMVFLASRTLGMIYVLARCSKMEGDAASDIASRCQSRLKVTSSGFILVLITFAACTFFRDGYDPGNSPVSVWWMALVLLAGLLAILAGVGRTVLRNKPSFFITGLGVILVITVLMIAVK